MGPNKSSIDHKNSQLSQSLIPISHPMFAIAKQVKVSEDINHLKVQIRLANKQQFEEWQKRLKEIPFDQNLMQPIQQSYTTEGFCGDSGIALITYHQYPYLLSDEIKNRRVETIKYFQENQMWYLIYTVLSAAYNYHREGIKTGDIRPDNIFINADGQVKVASVNSWPGQQTNYEKTFFQKTITYLSPEQIKDLQFGKVESDCKKQLAESFSIGLTFLDAATLTNSKQLYSKSMKLNYQKLQEKFEDLIKIGYSEVLSQTIKSLCEVDCEFRISASEVFEWLQPNAEAIANLQAFELEDFPQKIKLIIKRNKQIDSSIKSQKLIGSFLSQPVSFNNQAYLPNPIPTGTTGFNLSSTINSFAPLSNFSAYVPSAINPLPSYNHPTSSYSLGYEGSLTYSQPHSSYGPRSLYEPLKLAPITNMIGGKSENLESHNFTLSKIDQQLQMSMKMFPA